MWRHLFRTHLLVLISVPVPVLRPGGENTERCSPDFKELQRLASSPIPQGGDRRQLALEQAPERAASLLGLPWLRCFQSPSLTSVSTARCPEPQNSGGGQAVEPV